MSNFDELFCKLIHSNRRIIIPDIGAFITNSPDENTVFSPLLKHNDGFLEDELQKEGIANPAIFLREFAENIISVVERGQCYYIAGLGYFLKDGSIRFVFEDARKELVNESLNKMDSTKNRSNRNRLRILSGLICLCMIVIAVLLFFIFNIHASKERPDMFTFQTEKTGNLFIIVDKSDICNHTDDLQAFPHAKSYHVVVSCFKEKDNAEKFVMQCKKNGYDRAEILSLTNVFYPVSIGAYVSHDEALFQKQEYDRRFGEITVILKMK
jgi:hypothetical protein